ncbi:hypothetical protein Bbelb_229370 [Branchiostoma belcheri]|nr:hypothetical protein Bbelb_229370 [Branchiostoma belcheri]
MHLTVVRKQRHREGQASLPEGTKASTAVASTSPAPPTPNMLAARSPLANVKSEPPESRRNGLRRPQMFLSEFKISPRTRKSSVTPKPQATASFYSVGDVHGRPSKLGQDFCGVNGTESATKESGTLVE